MKLDYARQKQVARDFGFPMSWCILHVIRYIASFSMITHRARRDTTTVPVARAPVLLRIENENYWVGSFCRKCRSLSFFFFWFFQTYMYHVGVIGVGDRGKKTDRKKNESVSGFGRFLAKPINWPKKTSVSAGINRPKNGFSVLRSQPCRAR